MRRDKTPLEESIPIAPSLDLEEEDAASNPMVNTRLFFISIQVVFNAIVIGFMAKVMVALINLITNISFYGKVSLADASPAGNHLGAWVIVVPVVGGLLVGIMAKLGSKAIRGHGIPEAMEQVLTNKSRIKPVVTLLKPISAAFSIGTGGPFGAEGPIISTGGAFGSLVGQLMHITPNERKVMLTAGATAGMAAIFGTPISSVLLAVELLLFEFSPRSIIPVALACATGAAMHLLLFGINPVFGMPAIPEPSYQSLIIYVLLGAVIGVVAAFISKSVYWIEDMFEKSPIHWMWWPAIGAIAVGIVGYFAPNTMGVGYYNITTLLTGSVALPLIIGLSLMKFISWSISLGSGTSGGTLAPLLTIGGGTGLLLGVLVLKLFPQASVNLPTCALIGMAAMFAGSSRALLTSIVFAFETTQQPHGLLPLLGACTASYFISFFMMKSTIMTEKINRRGVITPDMFEPDVLQSMQVSDVMGEDISKVTRTEPMRYYVYPETRVSMAIDLMDRYKTELMPVVLKENKNQVIGVVNPSLIFAAYRQHRHANEDQRSISLKRKGYEMMVKGRQRFRRD
ncbi:MAG TPA: chloride channel protein [Puia sp.]|nr:chloride channel protein [Puia sp.]